MEVKRKLIVRIKDGTKYTFEDSRWKSTSYEDGILYVLDEYGVVFFVPIENVLCCYRPVVDK